MQPLSKLISRAWERSAFHPEIIRDRYWVAYGNNATAVVIPEKELRDEAPALFYNKEPGTFNPSDPDDPNQGMAQVIADYLEKYTGCICLLVELKEESWLGRCTTAWLNCKDVTDWHAADTEEALIWELIDAYGDAESVEAERPKNPA